MHKEPARCRPKIQQNRCAMPFEVLRLRRCLRGISWVNLFKQEWTVTANHCIQFIYQIYIRMYILYIYHVCMYLYIYIKTRACSSHSFFKQLSRFHIHPLKRSGLTSKCLLIWELPWRQISARDPFVFSKVRQAESCWNDSIQNSRGDGLLHFLLTVPRHREKYETVLWVSSFDFTNSLSLW